MVSGLDVSQFCGTPNTPGDSERGSCCDRASTTERPMS